MTKQKTMTFFATAIFCLICNNTSAGAKDPLDLQEMQSMSTFAEKEIGKKRAQKRHRQKTRALLNNTVDNDDYELLLVERHRPEKGENKKRKRLADVYWYDYERNMLVKSLVNIKKNKILKSEELQGTQLPLTERELSRALDIIFSDQRATQEISDQYKAITGNAFSDPSQIEIKAFVFHADTAKDMLQADSLKCGLHRCAQVMLYTHDRVAFEIMPIVDLSERKVTDILAGF